MAESIQNHPQQSQLPVRFSLRSKLLTLLLGITLVIVVVIGFVSIDAVRQFGQTARQSSSIALRSQAEKYLVRLVRNNAQQNDLILEKVRGDARRIAQYTAFVFNQPQAFAPQSYWSIEDHMQVGSEGQYINGPDDISSVFVPNTVTIDDNIRSTLELAAYLDFVFAPTFEADPNIVAVYFLSKSNVTRLHPNINLGQIVPPDFLATEDIFFSSGTPENNPERETVWTPVYQDPAGQGALVSAISPVYLSNGEFVGIIGIDVQLEKIGANVETGNLIDGAYSFLIDDQGRAIALPPQGYQDILNRSPAVDEFGADLNSASSDFSPVITQMKEGTAGFANLTVGSRDLLVAYAPLKSTGWSLGTVVESEKVLQGLAPLRLELASETNSLLLNRLLPVGLISFVIVLLAGWWLTYRLVDPLKQLTLAARRIGAREWTAPLPPAGADEVGVLSQTLGTMATQLRDLFGTLEEQVIARTRRLETVANLSQQLNAILDQETLLTDMVNHIKDSLGYYHAHIYLLNEDEKKLVVAAGTGPAGQQMKAKGHSIELAATSLVAKAARSGEIVIVENVREVEEWLPNPLLPDTHAEIAVPIVLEAKVIGVLDVQEDRVAGLDESDANLLRSLANQAAVSIRNIRLLAKVEEDLAAARALQRQYVEQTWNIEQVHHNRARRVQFSLGESSDLDETHIVTARQQALRHKAPALIDLEANGTASKPVRALVAPIVLHGTAIGNLQLHEVNHKQWDEEELTLITAVIDQVAQTAENLRLLDRIQERAGREQLISQISAKLRRAPDIETLMQIGVTELSRLLKPARTFVRLGPETTFQTGAPEVTGNGLTEPEETNQDESQRA